MNVVCDIYLVDEMPRRQSWWTRLWGGVVWMASGYQPTTYSYQKSLPRLPVPCLNQTVDQFLLSMEPLYGADSEQFKKLCTSAQVMWSRFSSHTAYLYIDYYTLVCNEFTYNE